MKSARTITALPGVSKKSVAASRKGAVGGVDEENLGNVRNNTFRDFSLFSLFL